MANLYSEAQRRLGGGEDYVGNALNSMQQMREQARALARSAPDAEGEPPGPAAKRLGSLGGAAPDANDHGAKQAMGAATQMMATPAVRSSLSSQVGADQRRADLVSQIPTGVNGGALTRAASLAPPAPGLAAPQQATAASALMGSPSLPPQDVGASGFVTPGATPAAQQMLSGIYRQGNSFGDSPAAAAWGATGSKNPTANDKLAADALVTPGAQQQFTRGLASVLDAPPQVGTGQSASNMLSRIPGVYENGRGQYSDMPTQQGVPTQATNPMMAMASQQPEYQPPMHSAAARSMGSMADAVGITPGGGGLVTHGIDSGAASAQRVADIYKSMAGMGGGGPAQALMMQPPEVLHSGNSWSRRNDLRNAEVSSKSLRGEWDMYRDGVIDRNGRPIQGAKSVSGDRAKFNAMLAHDMALKSLEPTLAGKAMQENAAIGREGMQQAGANLRTGMQQQGQAQRFLTTTLMQAGRDRRADQHQATQDSIARQRLGLDTFRATRGSLPAGYRQSPDGAGLEFIPGGPADPSTIKGPLNDTQSKALQFGTRMQASGQNMDQLAAGGVDQPGLIKRGADALGLGTLANWTQSPQQQQVEQSQRDFVNAVLRRESGAAISESEFDSARRQYFPQIGDSPQVAEQKRQNRELATRGMLAEVPDGDRRVQQVRGTPAQNGGQPSALDELRRRAQSNPELADRLRAAGY